MKVVLATPHDYDVIANGELPMDQSERLFEFKPSNHPSVRTRCMVTFRPTGGDEWTGRFVGDYDEPPAISLVCSGAASDRAFVVCAGRAYYVDVGNPDRFEVVGCFPICSTRVVPGARMILLGSFTDLVAYGSNGLAWKAAGIVSDDLNIVEADEQTVTVEGADAASGRTIRLTIDLHTGKRGAPAPDSQEDSQGDG